MTDRIVSALSHIDPTDRDTWLTIGMAIKSELGDSGYSTWLDWSKASDKFNSRDAASVWKSIRPHGAVTLGSLFHLAKSAGWKDDGLCQPLTPAQIAERKRKAEIFANAEADAIERERLETAAKAKRILEKSARAENNPYLERKGVHPTPTLRQLEAEKVAEILGYQPQSSGKPLEGMLLVVPVKQGDSVSTLELVDDKGRKAALAGRGSKAGGFWATQRLTDGPVVIGEGVATVLSVTQATGIQGVAALSATNLLAVTEQISKRCSDITILADLDKDGSPHPKALEAAEKYGRLAIPFFPDKTPDQSDFNDMALAVGLHAVKAAVLNASKIQSSRDAESVEVSLINAADIRPEVITWIWNGWLAAGKMHIFAGAPGTGKTTISMALTAILSKGGRWPDGSTSMTGNIVIWSGEDDPKDTLVPRLIASGANLTNVHFVGEVKDRGERRSFDLASDMEHLKRCLRTVGNVRLLIVDPIVSAIVGDSHKNAEVRRSLQPLADMAKELGFALLGITHFSKSTSGRDPVERLTGSLAFGALARVVMVAAKYQDGEMDKRLFCRAKSNIGPDDGGFYYDLSQSEITGHPDLFASHVAWGGKIEGSARDLLAEADDAGTEEGSTASAKQFLHDLLLDGPLRAGEVFKDADQAGYSKRTIQRAAKALGVERDKDGMRGPWVWKLPPKMPKITEDAKDAKQILLAPSAPSGQQDSNQSHIPTLSSGETAIEGLSDSEEQSIRKWLGDIKESDPVVIEETVTKARNNKSDRQYLLGQANG